MFKYRVKAERGFKDGSIYPLVLRVGEVIDVDEQTYLKMKQSDPESIILVEKVIPNPKKVRKDGVT